MRSSLRTPWPVGVLILSVLVVLGSGADAFDTEDAFDSEDALRQVRSFMSPEQIQLYQDSLGRLLANPCDEVPSSSFNEIHDCQRFIIPGEERFGPLVGIFPDSAVVRQPAQSFRDAKLAAYITNAGGDQYYPDVGYEPLGIRPKPDDGPVPSQYCLWLRWDNPDDPQNGWRAAIIPNRSFSFGDGELGCDEVPEEGDWGLNVKRRTKQNTDSIPPTARWGWTNPMNFAGQHYIEIKCGLASCGVTHSSVNLPNNLPPGQIRRTVPGWFDAQFLAVYDQQALAQGDSILVPGPWGVVWPMMGPNFLNASAVDGWKIAARIRVFGDPGPYRDKFLLNPAGWAQIWINTDGPAPRARFDNTSVSREVGVITGDRGHGPHGSTRWRWHPDDEGPWMPCDDFGCCEPET